MSDVDAAIVALAERLRCVSQETIVPAAGRVLAQAVIADRDSPAADVSSMDGYAIRQCDLARRDPLPVAGEICPGQPPPRLPEQAALRIFTGAVVPPEAELVVKREDTHEQPERVQWTDAARGLAAGAHIRRRGENGRGGAEVLAAGSVLNAAAIAAASGFGAARVSVFRRVAVSVIVTGDELLAAADSPAPWQVRDSNGPAVAALLANRPDVQLQNLWRCPDAVPPLRALLERALGQSDAVILSGGVSKGDYDHVPGVIAAVGGEVVFHRLPIRPGQPVLGATTTAGQLILALPGNPVSAVCCLRRLGMPLLRKLGGHRQWQSRPLSVRLENPDDKTLPLRWMRLVQLAETVAEDGLREARLIAAQGSGDLVALAASDGFIEQPPQARGTGPWPFYRW